MNGLQKINKKLGGFSLSDLFTYDPDTGIIRHNPDRPKESFKTSRAYKRWLTILSGKVAGECYMDYLKVRLAVHGNKLRIYNHRLALHLSGVEIAKGLCVDHIDGNGSNNRLSNLRVVTHQENMRNTKLSSRNTSGTIGVWWSLSSERWQAQIRVENKNLYLGRYTNKDDAIEARKAAEIKYGFHENHGRPS
jgi:hypothetical protein